MRRKDNQEVHSCVLNNRPKDAWHLEASEPRLGCENNDHQKCQKVCRYLSELKWETSSEKANRRRARWLCRRFPPSDVW